MHTFLFIPFVVTYRSWAKNFQLLNDSYSNLAIEQTTVQITSHLWMPLQYVLKLLPARLTELPQHGAQTTPPLPFSLKPPKPSFYNYSCYLHLYFCSHIAGPLGGEFSPLGGWFCAWFSPFGGWFSLLGRFGPLCWLRHVGWWF